MIRPQLSLLSDEEQSASFRDSAWRQLQEILNEQIKLRGIKQVAWELGASEGELGNSMRGANRSPFKASWIPVLIAIAGDDRALEFLASLRGFDLVKRKELTAEQKLERLERALAEEFPRQARGIVEKAYGGSK